MAAESSVGPALPARPAAPEVVPDDGTATVDRTATNDATTQPSPTGGNGEDVVAPQSMPAPRAPGNEPPAVTPTRVRSRLVRFGTRPSTGSPVLEPLMAAVRANQPKADVGLLERAYATAEEAHRGQTRRSGDPYITHPVAVATILADLGMTPPTLAAALLHDTVEDTEYSLNQLSEDFGEEIAKLVDGVTKLDRVSYGDAAQAETVRKMVVAMSRDIRVLVIKLADRLHNARTWRFVPQESARRKARETLEIYAPLAHRLGMNTIKWELEDLAFATLYPKVYEEIVHLGVESGEGEVLQLPLDRVHAEPVRQRRLDLERLAGLPPGRLLRHEPPGPGVVQPVSQLDDQHADVPRHRHDHLADGLGLGGVPVRDPVQLGDAVDKLGDLLAEVLLQLVEGVLGVLHRVVQQCRGQGRRGHPEVGEDRGDGDGVGDVGVTATPRLAAVGLLSGRVRALQQPDVGLGLVRADRGHQRLENR